MKKSILALLFLTVCLACWTRFRSDPVGNAPKQVIQTNAKDVGAVTQVRPSIWTRARNPSSSASSDQLQQGMLFQSVVQTSQGSHTQTLIYGGSFPQPRQGRQRNIGIGDDAHENALKEIEMEKVLNLLASTGQTNNFNPAVTERWFELRRLARSLHDGMPRSEVLQLFGPPTREDPNSTGFEYDPKPGGGPLMSQNYKTLGIRFDQAGKLQTWEWFERWIN